MDKIFNKLHSYDIMGYLIPGIFTLTYIVFGLSLLNYSTYLFDKNIITDSIVFFVLCYYIGLINQEVGFFIEKYELKKSFKDTYSHNILKRNSQIISLQDKIKCWNIIRDHFKIPIDLHIKDKKQLNAKINEYGQNCYVQCRESLKYLYRNSNILNQSEVFNIHYGMSRNLLVSSLLSILYFSIITILLIYQNNHINIIALALTILSYVCSKMLYKRTQRYAKYHVSNTIKLYLTTYDNTESPSINITR